MRAQLGSLQVPARLPRAPLCARPVLGLPGAPLCARPVLEPEDRA